MKQSKYMNSKIIIFVSILFALASCRPFTTTLSSSKNKEITENETEENVVEPKKKDYYRIPSGPIDDETNVANTQKKENFLIPSGPMDTEELLIAQAKAAAKEQALKRAEMARKRKAAEAAKDENGITATTGADIPRIDQLEDKQAKDAAKELLAKRAAMERAKRMEATKIKEREERLANKESEEELKRINDEKIAAEKAKEKARLLAIQKVADEKAAEEARLLAIQKVADEKAAEEARLLAIQKAADEKAAEEARLLAIQKEKLEKIKEEAAKAAAIAAEKLKELERLEAERLELERLEQERIAQENAEREARNAAAIAAAKTEKERIEREQIAAAEKAAAAAKAKADRLEKERLAEEAAIAEAKAEKERLEKERLAKEAAIAEAKAEEERLAKEAAIAEAKAEKERLAKEAAIAEAEAEKERIAAKKAEADKLEAERIALAKEEARKKAIELAAAKQAEKEADEERKKNLAKIATNTETVINEDAKTVATKEIDETEKERAARYARQTLELQKESDKKAGWLLSKKEKEERKTFDNQPENAVANEAPIAPRETTSQPERMLSQANIPISIADMDSDPALNKINAVPSPTLKKYYFPIQDLETAKAYCFVSSGSTIDTTYWLMKSISFGGKSYLITEKYDHNFVMTSSSRERINELGAYVEDYTAYESSGLGGSIAVEYWVEDDEGFKWNMDNGSFAMVSMNFNSSDFPNYDITAYRERHLINGNATYSFKDKTLPAIVLEDRQTTVYVDNKSNEESYPSSYENYFAEGIGLVKFTINKRDKGFTLARTYTLSHIIPYDDWQRITK